MEIEKRGKIRKSAGIKNTSYRGLSAKVFRVSIRKSKGYLGYLTTFFNVPGIFGSTTYQSNNYIGVDCADVLVAAYAKSRAKSMRKNYKFQHIGAISGDSNNNGILDKGDLILHAGPLPLHYSYLSEGYFDGHVVILKPSSRLL